MFKLGTELLEKIKQSMQTTQLAYAESIYSKGCFGCSGECSSGCKGSCDGSCYGGCGGSCSGHTR